MIEAQHAGVTSFAGAQRAREYVRIHADRFVRELTEFVRFPSIGAQPQRAGDVLRCAKWLANHLSGIGLPWVRLVKTDGHPIVHARWTRDANRPTLLIYGHYDVQPVDPEKEWRHPPFHPKVVGRDLYGRGACDDKGQLFVHVKALEAFLKTSGALPINVHCVFEGEEESGSSSLEKALVDRPQEFAANACIVSDMSMPAPGRPAITYSLRGSWSCEIEVTGPRSDLHSGVFGGVAHNPLQVLGEVIAGLHDDLGRIDVPGFYSNVRSWSAQERAYMRRVGPSDEALLRSAGARAGWGESGYSLYERATIRPALTINGLSGGYQGAGPKSVIPARASTKINFRLAADQDPKEVERSFRRHVARVLPPTVTARITGDIAARPVVIDREHPVIEAAIDACRRGFGREPVFLRSGGTIPVVSLFQERLGLPLVLLGFALPTDGMHAPNEKFHLPNFFGGIATSIEFLAEMARRRDLRPR
ncbi:MAG TPA: dipeptidase [Actinomycetota bacterium]|nr:dipeptidase [Actinomycetota bacterium]